MKKYSSEVLLLIAFVLAGAVRVFCQSANAIPPSTHAINSARIVDAHMVNFAGLAPVNIPVYTIKSGKLAHQISLNYQSAGNRVEDEASWVGLGFSLQVGGIITRTVRGLPDDKPDGFFNGAPTFPQVSASDALLLNAAENKIDTHPDIFLYEFDGYAGRIIFDRSSTPHFIPQRNFKVEKAADLSSITIIIPNGTRYLFASVEKARVIDSPTSHTSLTNEFVSAWFLTTITSADGTSKIDFIYTEPATLLKEVVTDESNFKTTNNGYFERTITDIHKFKVEFKTLFLDKISFSNGYISFVKSSRDDIVNSFKLDKIEINYLSGSLFKEFVLNHSYFSYRNTTNKKLSLDKCYEQSGSIQNLPYIFYYTPQSRVANNIEKAIDHWGFFNGQPQTIALPHRLIHLKDQNTPVDIDDYSFLDGDAMESDVEASKTFMLYAMKMPTGGVTEFEYELNEIDTPDETFTIVKSYPISLSKTDTKTKTFTVTSNLTHRGAAAVLTITSECGVIGDPCTEDKPFEIIAGCPFIELKGPVSHSWGCQYNNRKYEFYLPKGTYALKVSANSSKNFSVNLVYYSPKTISVPKRGAGLRISKIKTQELGKPPTIKKFLYTGDDGKTTGKLNADFNYETKAYALVDKENKYGELLDKYQPVKGCYLKRYQSNGKVSLGFDPSYTVGYSRITELQGENGENGKIEYYYRSDDDYQNTHYLTQQSWTKGYLERRIVYKKSDSGFKKEKEVVYDYDFDSYPDAKKSTINGFAIGKNEEVKDGCTGLIQKSSYTKFEYSLNSDWFFLNKVTNIDYDNDGKTISKSTTFGYDFGNLLQTKITEETSNADKKITTLINYPPNYSDQNSFISDLKNRHIINIPVEQVTYLEKDLGNSEKDIQVLSARINTFKRGDNTNSEYVGRFDSDLSLLVPEGKPLTLDNFKFSNADKGQFPDQSNPAAFELDESQYTSEIAVEDYDLINGNPTRFSSTGNKIVTRWGYNGDYVICKAANSDLAYYSSFETPASETGWDYTGEVVTETSTSKSKTGSKYYNLLNGDIKSQPINSTQKYLLSFWAKGGEPTISNVIEGNANEGVEDNNGWKYFRRIVGNTDVITLGSNGNSILIDELVLVEADATVETCTYDPLKGKTSQGDINGKIVKYEYDELGRVKFVRDQNGNITERYEYNLK